MRKYDWYKDSDHINDGIFSKELIESLFKKYGCHLNDFPRWWEYFTHLGSFAVQVEPGLYKVPE